MKNQSILFTAIILLTLIFTNSIHAQERGNSEPRVSPNSTVSQTIGTTVVTISYGRPAVNERDIFGGLVPYGEVWRTGANEATTITISDDVTVEGNELSAGTYGLFTIPEPDKWTVIFNRVANQWGAYEYDSNEDIIRAEVTPQEGPHMEQFMIYFENVTANSASAVLHWNSVKVPFTIEL